MGLNGNLGDGLLNLKHLFCVDLPIFQGNNGHQPSLPSLHERSCVEANGFANDVRPAETFHSRQCIEDIQEFLCRPKLYPLQPLRF